MNEGKRHRLSNLRYTVEFIFVFLDSKEDPAVVQMDLITFDWGMLFAPVS